MSRASRRLGAERTLSILEDDFRRALVAGLRRCAAGAWGLFGQNDVAAASLGSNVRERLYGSDARHLIELGNEIESLREQLTLPQYDVYQRFMEYLRRRDPNAPGEPTLARQMLSELGES